mmetsp:Transcript_925/g.3094  ORF Transcript_925/g.3094 Transcript_925/m.3094 type:complete len:217 (+) Transcript_925:46-696(+)
MRRGSEPGEGSRGAETVPRLLVDEGGGRAGVPPLPQLLVWLGWSKRGGVSCTTHPHPSAPYVWRRVSGADPGLVGVAVVVLVIAIILGIVVTNGGNSSICEVTFPVAVALVVVAVTVVAAIVVITRHWGTGAPRRRLARAGTLGGARGAALGRCTTASLVSAGLRRGWRVRGRAAGWGHSLAVAVGSRRRFRAAVCSPKGSVKLSDPFHSQGTTAG